MGKILKAIICIIYLLTSFGCHTSKLKLLRPPKYVSYGKEIYKNYKRPVFIYVSYVGDWPNVKADSQYKVLCKENDKYMLYVTDKTGRKLSGRYISDGESMAFSGKKPIELIEWCTDSLAHIQNEMKSSPSFRSDTDGYIAFYSEEFPNGFHVHFRALETGEKLSKDMLCLMDLRQLIVFSAKCDSLHIQPNFVIE